MVQLELTVDTVMEVEGRLSGRVGPGGTASVILQKWILRFGEAISNLQSISIRFLEWLTNHRPHWAAYWSLTEG